MDAIRMSLRNSSRRASLICVPQWSACFVSLDQAAQKSALRDTLWEANSSVPAFGLDALEVENRHLAEKTGLLDQEDVIRITENVDRYIAHGSTQGVGFQVLRGNQCILEWQYALDTERRLVRSGDSFEHILNVIQDSKGQMWLLVKPLWNPQSAMSAQEQQAAWAVWQTIPRKKGCLSFMKVF